MSSTEQAEEFPFLLRREICEVINRHSAENDSNTPDFVLAQYLVDCFDAFNRGVNARTRFYTGAAPEGRAREDGGGAIGCEGPDDPGHTLAREIEHARIAIRGHTKDCPAARPSAAPASADPCDCGFQEATAGGLGKEVIDALIAESTPEWLGG